MTKPFDNGTSIFQITFTKLARFRREGQSGHAVRYSLFAFRSSPEGQLQLVYHGCSRVSSLAIRHHPVAAFVRSDRGKAVTPFAIRFSPFALRQRANCNLCTTDAPGCRHSPFAITRWRPSLHHARLGVFAEKRSASAGR